MQTIRLQKKKQKKLKRRLRRTNTLAPPRSLPKLMRKSDIIKIDLKYVNIRKIVPKWVPKWSSFFPGFGQKWHQNLMWIPRWPQRTPGDPKMDPKDLKMVQKWYKMTQKSTQNGSKMEPTWNQNHKEKKLNYITIPEPDWTLLQTFHNQLARRYTSRRLLNIHLSA